MTRQYAQKWGSEQFSFYIFSFCFSSKLNKFYFWSLGQKINCLFLFFFKHLESKKVKYKIIRMSLHVNFILLFDYLLLWYYLCFKFVNLLFVLLFWDLIIISFRPPPPIINDPWCRTLFLYYSIIYTIFFLQIN